MPQKSSKLGRNINLHVYLLHVQWHDRRLRGATWPQNGVKWVSLSNWRQPLCDYTGPQTNVGYYYVQFEKPLLLWLLVGFFVAFPSHLSPEVIHVLIFSTLAVNSNLFDFVLLGKHGVCENLCFWFFPKMFLDCLFYHIFDIFANLSHTYSRFPLSQNDLA